MKKKFFGILALILLMSSASTAFAGNFAPKINQVRGTNNVSQIKLERISTWCGKVNQHFDIGTNKWVSDADGVSGCDLDPLQYCKKFYPNTVSVSETPYTTVTLSTWRESKFMSSPINYTSTKPVTYCVQR